MLKRKLLFLSGFVKKHIDDPVKKIFLKKT